MILVVGATGQLGTSVVRRLSVSKMPVRALVRRTSSFRHLEDVGAEIAFGYLRDAASLDAACSGVRTVIATATGIAPGAGGGDVKAVDDEGYAALIQACQRNGVHQFIFASMSVTPADDQVLLSRAKRLTERRLRESGIASTIFQFGMFADIWPALLGSRIPERDAEVRSLERPFWFTRAFRKTTGDLIETRGRAIVPGRGDVPVSFITIDNAADLLVSAVDHPEAMNQVLEIGGPVVSTFDETVQLFARLLGRPVRASYAPAVAFRAMQTLLSPISRSAGSLMGLNWLTASGNMRPPDPQRSRDIAARFGVTLTSFDEFLRSKMGADRPAAPSSGAPTIPAAPSPGRG
jgi:uncharacterized protein YbjT (DUF2867 family)